MNIIMKAALDATRLHAGQVRKYTGEPYIYHPMRVAGRLSTLPCILETEVAAAWLHDVLEDCKTPDGAPITMEYMSSTLYYPDSVIALVEELTNPSKAFPHLSRAERKRMDRNHIAQASIPAKTIKLLDRIDNLRDLKAAPYDFKELYADESVLLQNVIYTTASTTIDLLCRELLKAAAELTSDNC